MSTPLAIGQHSHVILGSGAACQHTRAVEVDELTAAAALFRESKTLQSHDMLSHRVAGFWLSVCETVPQLSLEQL